MRDDTTAIREALAHPDAVFTVERIERLTLRRDGFVGDEPLAPAHVGFDDVPRALPASTTPSSPLATALRWLVVSLFVLGALGFFVMSSGSGERDRRPQEATQRNSANTAQPPLVRPAATAAAQRPRRARPRSSPTATPQPQEPSPPAAVEASPSSAERASYVTPAGREVIRAPGGYLNAADSPLLR